MKIRIEMPKKRLVMMMSLALPMPGNRNKVNKEKILDELQKKMGCIDFGIFLVYNFNMISHVTVAIDRQGAIPIIIKRGSATPTACTAWPLSHVKDAFSNRCFFCKLF